MGSSCVKITQRSDLAWIGHIQSLEVHGLALKAEAEPEGTHAGGCQLIALLAESSVCKRDLSNGSLRPPWSLPSFLVEFLSHANG